ncbi:MAG TPA: pilus assembly protein TadG-related protein [Chloroflexota bacterium]
MKRFFRQEDGSAAVLIVLCMTVLVGFMGLVVDGGMLFYERTQLQKAVDAAALAAAYDLPINPGNAASDATTYLQSNGVVGGTNQTTVTYNGNPSSGSGPYPANQMWKVTAQRHVPTGFGGLVGFSQGTVTATATAVNSPLSSVNNLVPYAIWGGNTVTPEDAYTTSHAPPGGIQGGPCCGSYNGSWGDWCTVDPLNTQCVPTMPSADQIYNYMTFWELNAPASWSGDCTDGGGPYAWCLHLDYRDNGWPSSVVWPDPQKCGNNNQPPCNPNWNVGGNVKFKGFFNNLQGSVAAGWLTGAWTSSGGDGTGKQAWNVLCPLLAEIQKNKQVAVMPVVDKAAYDTSSGTISFHVPFFIGVQLDQLSGCADQSGNSMGTFFSGWARPDWTTTRGVGGGNQAPGAAHVLQLWQ